MASFTALSTSTAYATLLPQISDRDSDLAMGFDPLYCTPTNVLTNSVRINSASGKFQRYNGTSWVDAFAVGAGAFTTITTSSSITAGGSVFAVDTGLLACGTSGSYAGMSGNVTTGVVQLQSSVGGSLATFTASSINLLKPTDVAGKLTTLISGTGEALSIGTSTNNTPHLGIYSNGALRAKLRASSAETALFTQGALPLLLGTNDTEYMRISATGAVSLLDTLSVAGATTLAACTASSLTLTTALSVAQGGTGLTTLTANGVVLGNGTTSPTFVAPSTSGNVLSSNGTTWVSSTAPLTGRFQSSAQTITSGGTITIAHGLGVIPILAQGQLTCTTAEYGYSVGDIIVVPAGVMDVSSARGWLAVVDATNISIKFGTTATSTIFVYHNKSTGAVQGLTNANWTFSISAWG